jgi:agmatinase
MHTPLQLGVLLRLAILVAGAVTHEHEHDELHDEDSLEMDPHTAHGHTHGEQLPLGYVKYPWQAPQTHATYPGDNEGTSLPIIS